MPCHMPASLPASLPILRYIIFCISTCLAPCISLSMLYANVHACTMPAPSFTLSCLCHYSPFVISMTVEKGHDRHSGQGREERGPGPMEVLGWLFFSGEGEGRGGGWGWEEAYLNAQLPTSKHAQAYKTPTPNLGSTMPGENGSGMAQADGGRGTHPNDDRPVGRQGRQTDKQGRPLHARTFAPCPTTTTTWKRRYHITPLTLASSLPPHITPKNRGSA